MTDSPTAWTDPSPPATTDPRANTVLTIAAVLLTLVVLATLVGVVVAKRGTVFGHGGRPDSVVLTAANAGVSDPFMPSATSGSVAVSADAVQQIQAMTGQLPPSQDRGVRLVSGTHPGLYGGSAQVNPCDVAAIANYLDGHPDVGRVWAQIEGLRREQIPSYLNTLTPVILTTDTWVTSHGYADGRATPSQTVLQAGNAVMIDQGGVPRVHCAGGNPLQPPANENLAALHSSGRPWPGYDPQAVVAVAYTNSPSSFSDPVPTAPVTEFSLTDLGSAQQLVRNAGGTIDLSAVPSAGVALPNPIAANRPPEGAGGRGVS
jgi:hypothetical protein